MHKAAWMHLSPYSLPSVPPPLSESAITKAANLQVQESTSRPQQEAHLRAWAKLYGARRGSVFHVVALGGSMTAGTHCTRGSPNTDCAFPARLGRRWRSAVEPRPQVVVSNRATGGMHSLAALAQLEQLVIELDGDTDGAPDLLLVDFSANDWTLEMPGWAERAKATEALLRQLRSAHPHLAVILMLTAVQGTPGTTLAATSCLRPLGNHSGVAQIASHYGFPTAAYLDALDCPVSTAGCRQCQPPAWFHLYKGQTTVASMTPGSSQSFLGLHPGAKTHELIASFVDSWWRRYVSKLRERSAQLTAAQKKRAAQSKDGALSRGYLPPPALPSVLDADVLMSHYSSCRPLVVHNAKVPRNNTAEASNRGSVANGTWHLSEDRPGKPGWISSGAPGATLTFPVAFGAEPRLWMIYEKGYDGFGTADLIVGKVKWSKALAVSGKRTDGLNVTQAEVLHLSSGEWGMLGTCCFDVVPHSNTTLRLRSTSGGGLKFKVRSVLSC